MEENVLGIFALSKSHSFSYLKLIQIVLFIYIFPKSKSGSGPLSFLQILFFLLYIIWQKQYHNRKQKYLYVPHPSVAVFEILLDLIPWANVLSTQHVAVYAIKIAVMVKTLMGL